MFRRIASDRRLLLVAAECVLIIALTRWIIPPQTGFSWVIASGYWFMLGAVVLFCWALWPFVRARWQEYRVERLDRLAAFVAVATVGIWIAQEKPGFKILADEVLLLGTSMGMHYERTAAYPIRATDVQGPFQILDHVLDKRPLLFPFLTATVHDVTGYRPTNQFYLNMGLALVFLTLAYLVGTRAGGHRWAGITAMVLFAGLPLLAQQSSGGGFELLNLTLIALVGLALCWYLEEPDTRRLEILVYSGVLLASTRYESSVFLLPVAAAAIWGWFKSGRVIFSWPVAISPVFLIPLLLQNRLFAGESGAWELAGVPNATEPFGFKYAPENLGHALAFFFDTGNYQPHPSSPLFAAAGLLAIPFFALLMIRVLREARARSANDVGLAFLGIGLFLVGGVYLFYFWGTFDHPVIRRLSLPVHLLMALSILVVGASLRAGARAWKAASLVALVGLLFHGLPLMAKRPYEFDYSPAVEMRMREDFRARLPEGNFLFIDNDAVFWVTHKIAASSVGRAKLKQGREGIAYHLRNHSFTQIFVFQSVLVEPDTGAKRLDPEDDLGPEFELETLWEGKVQTLLLARISRVVAVRDGGSEVRASEFVPVSVPPANKSKEEQEKDRTEYTTKWLRNLP